MKHTTERSANLTATLVQGSQSMQDEGNAAADNGQFSAALRLWEQAIRLTPDRAVLHEQKAQV